jgi:uncharacterized protein (DUF433 family)
MDWTRCPVVESDPEKLGGTPILKGSRMPADGIVENFRDGMPADEIAEVFELPTIGVRLLLKYALKQDPSLSL